MTTMQQHNDPHKEGRDRGRPELLEILRRDHTRIKDLFRRIEKNASNQVELRKEMFIVLQQELLLHMETEERFFYTASNSTTRPAQGRWKVTRSIWWRGH